jgi:WD40 repeat protein
MNGIGRFDRGQDVPPAEHPGSSDSSPCSATPAESREKRLFRHHRHAQQLWDARFSPDGRLLVTASQDGTAQVWDALTGEKIGPPMHHAQAVSMARFEPDSGYIVTGGFDGHASLWRFPLASDPAPGLLHRTEAATALQLDVATGGIRLDVPSR